MVVGVKRGDRSTQGEMGELPVSGDVWDARTEKPIFIKRWKGEKAILKEKRDGLWCAWLLFELRSVRENGAAMVVVSEMTWILEGN
ncbi:hypothetical protein ACH5RR_030207 [Cinchona calisaya]|uniref:Uncharacterized protein n=1 Tax=Cinchona calisaya TaxID=153742 RepID=A0ABD2YW53_9GENT